MSDRSFEGGQNVPSSLDWAGGGGATQSQGRGHARTAS